MQGYVSIDARKIRYHDIGSGDPQALAERLRALTGIEVLGVYAPSPYPELVLCMRVFVPVRSHEINYVFSIQQRRDSPLHTYIHIYILI